MRIKQKTYSRNTTLAGVLFLTAILSTGLMVFAERSERAVWFLGLLVIVSMINLMMSWTRYQITTEKIDLITNLDPQEP